MIVKAAFVPCKFSLGSHTSTGTCYAGGDFMRPVYTDLYALFRRDPGAEEYFNQLPAYVQDQLSARCRAVDSLERLHAYADQFQAKGSPELVEEIGGKAFLPPPFRP